MSRVITFGSFDVFHYGHLRLLQRASDFGSHLIVGVSSDRLNREKKGRDPIYPQDHRLAIVAGLACVHHVFIEDSLEKKRDYIREHRADILVMGDDWRGGFDDLADQCRVVYLPRTPSISTTATIEGFRT